MAAKNTNELSNSKATSPPIAVIKSMVAANIEGIGAMLFVVKYSGEVVLNHEEQGGWTGWVHPAWSPEGPKSIATMAACQSHGGLRFCCLDDQSALWSTALFENGAFWTKWEPPDWTKGQNLRTIAALQLPHTQIFWGTQLANDSLVYTDGPREPGRPWGDWNQWAEGGLPTGTHLIDIAATLQGDGRGALWGLDSKLQLRCSYQTNVGGPWTRWSEAKWNGAPNLIRIAACPQGPGPGASLWGVRQDGRIMLTYQDMPNGHWSAWAEFPQLPVTAMTAARQKNGTVRLWIVEIYNLRLWTIATAPNGQWGQWEYWPIS